MEDLLVVTPLTNSTYITPCDIPLEIGIHEHELFASSTELEVSAKDSDRYLTVTGKLSILIIISVMLT